MNQNTKTSDSIKSCPSIEGHVTIQLFNKKGDMTKEVKGNNIWTLTGREYLSELIGVKAFGVTEATRDVFRNDRVAYIGIGIGSQPEVSNIPSLVTPVSYDLGTQATGNFLAELDSPATLPAVSGNTPVTAIQFTKTFGANDFGGNTIVITEAGLFTDGDPDNNFAVGITTTWVDTASYSPVAYKTFEPITKTPDFTMKIVWEVRFL